MAKKKRFNDNTILLVVVIIGAVVFWNHQEQKRYDSCDEKNRAIEKQAKIDYERENDSDIFRDTSNDGPDAHMRGIKLLNCY